MDSVVMDLLAWRSPEQVSKFLFTWEESRSSTWADASRDALVRGASDGHVPQLRGQLRYHLGENSVAQAARTAGAGCLPMQTVSPGATFMVARIGRFALINQVLRSNRHLPRRSVTRKLLSQPNIDIDPQGSLLLGGLPRDTVKTELAYFGCLASVACRSDPSAPAELAIAIPSRDLDRWIAWITISKAHALLQELSSSGRKSPIEQPTEIADQAFSTFRLPKKEEGDGDNGVDS